MRVQFILSSSLPRQIAVRKARILCLLGIVLSLAGGWGASEIHGDALDLVEQAPIADPKNSQYSPKEAQATEEVLSVECQSAFKALDRGYLYIEGQKASSIEDAFVVSQLQVYAKREGLDRFIHAAREEFSEDPSIWYLVSGSPRITVPEVLPKGKELLRLISNTPHADPPRKSYDLAIDFLVGLHTGYLLTHQVFMLEVAKSRQIDLPDTINPNGSQYLGKIWLEQAEDTEFSDLYARRTFLLILYSLPSEEDATKWIKVLLNAQLEDGSWHDEKSYEIELGGESFKREPATIQTTIYATFAVSAYIKRFCEGNEDIEVK